jgi:hypothetical protein
MVNFYHILYKNPAIEKGFIEIEYEELAQELYKSGLVRIDADTERNFVKYTDPSISQSLFFSELELSDTILSEGAKNIIKKAYGTKFAGEVLKNHADKIYGIMQALAKRNSRVSQEKQIKLIRLLVQSTQPIVIKWILLDKVQIFISYGHSIGDVMDIKNWRVSGGNSGMQSTDGKDVCVFVSCGGDPFKDEYNSMYGDGFPAMARLQVIAAQELGHYSDIIRDNYGRQIGRHSANFSCTRAKENVLLARRNDVKNCHSLKTKLIQLGLARLLRYDANSKFYKMNKVGGIRVFVNSFMRYLYKRLMIHNSYKAGFIFIKLYQKEEYLGLVLEAIFDDMSFNLTPIADVYKKEDKNEEEAIACIEALARVPQQAMKWGHIATRMLMKDLYKIYYNQVIPDLINKYEVLTNTTYKRNFSKPNLSFLNKLKVFFSSNKRKTYL